MPDTKTLFWKLFEEEYEMTRAYCYRLTSNIDDANDLLHDAILKARRHFGDLRQIDKFRFWLYKIIGNTYKSRFREPWWKKVLSGLDNIDEISQTDPSGFYEAKRKLNRAFKVLSADETILITLFEIEGWKISEISEITGKSVGSIKMGLSRARCKMRKKLVDVSMNYRDLNELIEARKLCFAVKQDED